MQEWRGRHNYIDRIGTNPLDIFRIQDKFKYKDVAQTHQFKFRTKIQIILWRKMNLYWRMRSEVFSCLRGSIKINRQALCKNTKRLRIFISPSNVLPVSRCPCKYSIIPAPENVYPSLSLLIFVAAVWSRSRVNKKRWRRVPINNDPLGTAHWAPLSSENTEPADAASLGQHTHSCNVYEK